MSNLEKTVLAIVAGLVVVVAIAVVDTYIKKYRPHWYYSQHIGMKVGAGALFLILTISAVAWYGIRHEEIARESACLSWTLNRHFRMMSGVEHAAPELRAELKKEAELIASVVLHEASRQHHPLCSQGAEMWEGTKSKVKDWGVRIGKILMNFKPGRNERKLLMQEVAEEQYGIFRAGSNFGLKGRCDYRSSKVRQFIKPPWLTDPFGGWEKVKVAGSVAVYCTTKDGAT